MPCYDPRDNPEYVRSELKADINKLTRILCALCTRLEKHELYIHISKTPELSDWWKEHKAADIRRMRMEEKLRQEKTIKEVKLLKELRAKYPNV